MPLPSHSLFFKNLPWLPTAFRRESKFSPGIRALLNIRYLTPCFIFYCPPQWSVSCGLTVLPLQERVWFIPTYSCAYTVLPLSLSFSGTSKAVAIHALDPHVTLTHDCCISFRAPIKYHLWSYLPTCLLSVFCPSACCATTLCLQCWASTRPRWMLLTEWTRATTCLAPTVPHALTQFRDFISIAICGVDVFNPILELRNL